MTGRVRIAVLGALPLVALVLVGALVLAVRAGEVPGDLLEALRILMALVVLGTVASSWLHVFDPSRFPYALLAIGLSCCIVGILGLAVDALRYSAEHDHLRLLEDGSFSALVLFLRMGVVAKARRSDRR